MPDADEPRLTPKAELLWGDRKRPTRGRKPGLSLDRIVAEAIALADGDGLDALSMQRLAERLGKGTMSLYRYVSSKDDLIALMLDTAIGAPLRPEDDHEDWRANLARWAHETRDIFRAHPWTLQLVTTKRMMGPNETARLEGALRALSGLGLTPAQMMDTVLLVNGFVRGATQPDVDVPADEPDGVEPHDPSLSDVVENDVLHERYPTLAGVMAAEPSANDRTRAADEGFEFGLRCVLDGIEAQLSDA